MKHFIISRLQQTRATAIALAKEDEGQDLIEYALVAGVVGLAALTAMRTLGTKIGTAFSSVGSQLTSAT